MNNWNPLETQLHSWTPRRPSAGLKAKLFVRPAVAVRARQFSFGWLAPATVCLLFLVIAFNQRSGELARLAVASNQSPMMAMTLSNASFTAYLPGGFVGERNGVRPGTFEWTNHGHSTSSMASFPQSRTNYLKR